ncbi:alpha/beta hydrolase [Paenibacillus aurantius]|uniref:Alpha/beta hydrolase n=1 Tax=Paenibacillus aurantius TaxID=2918900 RepID=A0AA96LAP1_9BACL|nr:alpha/beta hydrolase [Paenibacillus aurantius]WNQ10284.1 alpha/beta hydrolase [Paenibacillus aurantius]
MTEPLWPQGAPLGAGSDIEDRPRLTPYLIDAQGPSAAVVVLPGGGYAHRAAHEGEPVARWLNTLGIHAFVLDYRIKPYRHPAPLLDAQRAIRTVRARAEEWRVDPDRVGILGFSAGGHLAASAGTHYDAGNREAEDPIERQGCRPDAMILCYPVVTMESFTHQGSRENLLGPSPDPALVSSLSIETRVTEDTPPAFVWHTSDDAAVPVENSLQLAGALSRCRVPFELHSFESGRHGIGLAEDHPEAYAWTSLCARWLRRRGFCTL